MSTNIRPSSFLEKADLALEKDSNFKGMNRRDFLSHITKAAVITTGFGISMPVVAQDFWSKPRSIDLQRRDTNERFLIVYHNGFAVDQSGYAKACEVLRDSQDGSMINMDIRLLDLICATQAWVRKYGYDVPFLVHSGYRSPRHNSRVEGAAKNSKHMKGEAIDFSVPGIPSSYMGKLAQEFLKTDNGGGGVGFYVSSAFTHMDTARGSYRRWNG